jgi:hypothetical protein
MNKAEFEKGEKIEIFDDFYIVGKSSNKDGKYKIILETKDPDIIEAYLEFFDKKLILFTKRKIDCKITHRGIRYNGKVYQIIKQYWENQYENKKWSRYRIHEIHSTKENKFDSKNPRKIIQDEDGNFVFENWQNLEEKDIEFDPVEKFENPQENLSKKFKIKFRETP